MRVLRRTIALSIICTITAAFTAQADLDFVVDVRPATVLLSSDTDDFEATSPGDPALGIGRDKEDAGQLSSMPTIRLGVGMDSEERKLYTNLSGGGGLLLNERFRSYMLMGDLAVHYKHRKNVSMGPHLSIIGFMDPEWHGDADVELDGDVGWLLGFEVAIGYDILFVFSIDYMDASFDASATAPTRITDTELDFSGVAIQFGMRGNF